MANEKPTNDDELTVTVEEDTDAPEIEIQGAAEDNAGQGEQQQGAASAPAEQATIPAEEGIETLRRQLAEEKRRAEAAEAQRLREAQQRQQAERLAAESQQQIAQLSSSAEQAQYDAVMNAIDALNKEAEGAVADYERMLETGDYKGAAQAQRKLAQAEAKISRLEEGKFALETRIRRQQDTPPAPQAQAPAQQASDPVDAYIRQFSPRSQEYLRKHVDHVTDRKLNRLLIRAHEDAIDEGFIPDSDAYFDALDKKLGLVAAEQQQAAQQPPAPRRAPQVSAPVVRTPPSASGAEPRPTKVHLTRAQREAADASGVSYVDYAKNMLALQQSGEIGTQH